MREIESAKLSLNLIYTDTASKLILAQNDYIYPLCLVRNKGNKTLRYNQPFGCHFLATKWNG